MRNHRLTLEIGAVWTVNLEFGKKLSSVNIDHMSCNYLMAFGSFSIITTKLLPYHI